MQTSIDKLGRVVLPKQIRDHYGVQAGDIFTIEEKENEIVLKPVSSHPEISLEDGIWVFKGRSSENLEAVEKSLRMERLKSLGF